MSHQRPLQISNFISFKWDTICINLECHFCRLYFGATPGSTQVSLLALYSGIAPGGAQGMTWDAGAPTWVNCMQEEHPTYWTTSPAPSQTICFFCSGPCLSLGSVPGPWKKPTGFLVLSLYAQGDIFCFLLLTSFSMLPSSQKRSHTE